MEFGKILKEQRKINDLTQEDLAGLLNVSRSAISNWEIGRNYPDIQTLIEISKLLGVSIDFLLNEDEKVREAVDIDLEKKKNVKKIAIGLGVLLLLTMAIILYLVYPKEPSINYVREKVSGDIVGNTEIIPFKKKEIEEVYFNEGKLRIILDLSGIEAGYTIESGGDEVTIGLYRFRDKKSERLIPYDGIITIDLSNYTDVKTINILHY